MANDSNMMWIVVGIIVFIIIVAFAVAGNVQTNHPTYVQSSHVISQHQIVQPSYPDSDWILESPSQSADLEAILTYLLRRARYVDTYETFSDSAVTALKEASEWSLSSSSPPVWYYHSFDNLHNFQLFFSFEYNVWVIKPAL